MWCGPCLRLRVGVSSCVGGGVVGSAEGREEVVTHQLTAHTARVNSTGQTRSAASTHKHRRMDCLHHIVIPMSTCAHKETHMRNNT